MGVVSTFISTVIGNIGNGSKHSSNSRHKRTAKVDTMEPPSNRTSWEPAADGSAPHSSTTSISMLPVLATKSLSFVAYMPAAPTMPVSHAASAPSHRPGPQEIPSLHTFAQPPPAATLIAESHPSYTLVSSSTGAPPPFTLHSNITPIFAPTGKASSSMFSSSQCLSPPGPSTESTSPSSATTLYSAAAQAPARVLDRALKSSSPSDTVAPQGSEQTLQGQPSVAGSCAAGPLKDSLPLVQSVITAVEEMSQLLEGVVVNRSRCQRLCQSAQETLPLLSTPWQGCRKRPLDPELLALMEVLRRCHECIRKWSSSNHSKLKTLTHMLCSKQHEEEFMELNLALIHERHNLSLVLTSPDDVQPTPDDISMPGIILDTNGTNRLDCSLSSIINARQSSDLKGRDCFVNVDRHTAFMGSPCDTTAPNSNADYDNDTKSDLHSFIRLLVRNDEWAQLAAEDRRAVTELYTAKGLDLTGLLCQAQSQARATVLVNRISDLEYISWCDISGPGARGSCLERTNSGGRSTLFHGRWQGEEVAVKTIKGADTRQAQEQLARETYIMSTCTHPNIARVFGMTRDPMTGRPSIVMKFYPKGSLLDIMTQPSSSQHLTPAVRLRLARSIARGMAYLHERPIESITHGDLNPRNVLIDDRLRAHISDFGLSSMKTRTKTIIPTFSARSVLYTAPEVSRQLLSFHPSGTSPKPMRAADVYAFAMILYELVTGIPPFNGPDMTEMRILQLVASRGRPAFPTTADSCAISSADGSGVPVALSCIIERCWAHDQLSRPAFSQIVTGLDQAAKGLNLQLDI